MLLEQLNIYMKNSYVTTYTPKKSFEMDHRLKCKIQDHKASRRKHNVIYL